MCDYGRLSYDYIYSRTRLQGPTSEGKTITWKEGINLFKNKIQGYINENSTSKIAFLVSAWNSNETLYLIRKLKEQFLKDTDLFFCTRLPEKDQQFPKFRISGDRNPNINGINWILGQSVADKSIKALSERIHRHEITVLIFISGLPTGSIPEELAETVSKLDDCIAIDHSKSLISDRATLILPSLTFAEKTGSYINNQNRVQRVLPAINPVTGGKPEDIILQELCIALVGEGKVLSTSSVFEEMQEIEGFKGLSYQSLKDYGAVIPRS
jgi:predicted molibdopterin-dependent oxidoreductase YjgC